MISVKCPKSNCHNHTQVNEIFIGRPVRCSKCGTSFTIQRPAPASRATPKLTEPTSLPAMAEAPLAAAALSATWEAPTLSETENAEMEIAEVEVVEADEWEIPELANDSTSEAVVKNAFGEESAFSLVGETPEMETETIRPKRGGRKKADAAAEG